MRRATQIVALTTAGLLALSACGGDDGGSGDDPAPGENTAAASGGDTGDFKDPEREGPVEIEGATEGGTIKVQSVNGLNTMDPSEAYYTNTYGILSALVTRSLTQYVFDEEAGQSVLVPDLATDLGTPNEDFTEWTFEIRDGITFEDGTPVTAAEIKFGMERSLDLTTFPESPSGYAKTYYEGADEYEGYYTSGGESLDSIVADGQTLTITMDTPFPDMPYWGAFPANGPIPLGTEADSDYRLKPLATGPYKFGEYVPEKSLTLVRNEEWDPATDPGRTAYPESYEMDFDTPSEQTDQILLADQGDAQTTITYDDLLAPDYRKFLDEAPDRVVTGGSPCTFYWAPDYRKITDINIRKAIAYAYPYREVILAGGAIAGVTRIPGTNLMPPGTPGRTEYNVLGVEPGTTDPAKAKELLAAAGEEGYEISFLFATDDPNAVKVKDAIVAGLEAGGFTAKPVPTTLAETSTVRSDPNAPINVRSGGWCADWPSGASWFPPLLETNPDPENTGQNYSLFSEPAVDDRIAEILGLPIEEQAAAWNELDEMIATDYFPLFPTTGYTGLAMAHGSKINGMNSDIVVGMPTFRNMWVSQ